MPDNKLTQEEVEDSVRTSLEEAITVAERLQPHCTTVADFIQLLKLAVENPAQLRLLISLVKTPLPGAKK